MITTFDTAHSPETDASIKEAFNVFDYDGDGFIYAKDIYHIITNIGGPAKLSKEEASALLNDFDSDAKGRIRTHDISDTIIGVLTRMESTAVYPKQSITWQ
jgi:Ca2+-binding EF-hand superfamily protein